MKSTKTNSGLKDPWKPGQSGNPKGRPKKGSAIADILNKIGDEKYKDITKREQLMNVVYNAALKGSLPHVQFIADRTEGKAIERVQKQKLKDTIEIL